MLYRDSSLHRYIVLLQFSFEPESIILKLAASQTYYCIYEPANVVSRDSATVSHQAVNMSMIMTYDVSAGQFYTLDSSDYSYQRITTTNSSVMVTNWTTSTIPGQIGPPDQSNDAAATTSYIILFSTLFFIIGTVGIAGNIMVVSIVLSDSKMRRSMTNMLILNLALADSLIMLFGLPEIVLFLLNDGWQLGQVACSFNRTVLVCALYSSVLTLVAVCIERYIAIVFPIKAHILCTKKRIFVVMIFIWMFSGLCATPTAVFNRVLQLSNTPPQNFCVIAFHMDRDRHEVYNTIFKYTESAVFYFFPLSIQLICYAVIGRRLFVGVDKLHRNSGGASSTSRPNGRGPTRAYSEAIRARRGVVKMLMASVAIYFISYSPHQVLLYYSSFSAVSFDKTWMFHVLTYTLAYINSAANPILYCVFSDNFRSKFKVIFHRCLCCGCSSCCKGMETQRAITLHSYTEYTSLVRKNTQQQKTSQPAVAL